MPTLGSERYLLRRTPLSFALDSLRARVSVCVHTCSPRLGLGPSQGLWRNTGYRVCPNAIGASRRKSPFFRINPRTNFLRTSRRNRERGEGRVPVALGAVFPEPRAVSVLVVCDSPRSLAVLPAQRHRRPSAPSGAWVLAARAP